MWQIVHTKLQSNDIHADTTKALVKLLHSGEPQLFYQLDYNADNVAIYGDALVGVKPKCIILSDGHPATLPIVEFSKNIKIISDLHPALIWCHFPHSFRLSMSK